MKLNAKGLKNGIVRNKKYIIVSVILWIVISYSMFLAFQEEWYQARLQPKYVDGFEDSNAVELSTVTLAEGMEFVQNIKIMNDQFTGIALRFTAEEQPVNGKITVNLTEKNSEKTIGSWTRNAAEMPNGMFWEFPLEAQADVEIGNEYAVQILMTDMSGQQVNLSLTRIPSTVEISTFWDDEESEYAMEYRIINGNHNSLRFFVLALYIAMTAAIFLVVFLFLKNAKLEWVFVVLTMVIGGMYLFALPPYTVPDEASHFVTAYAQSSVLLGEDVVDEEGKVIVADSSLWGCDRNYPSRDSYQQFLLGALGRGTKIEEKEVSSRVPLEMRHPGYFPQVIGITLGRLLNVNCEQLLLLGRIFALIWYVFIMYFAIKVMPFGKMVLFVVGTLPMTMQMVVSYNYDSVLFGVCFFLTAYVLQLIYRPKKTGGRDILVLCVITAVIASIKFIYLPILGIALFIPKDKFKSKKQKMFAAVLVAGVGIVVLLYLKLAVIQNAAVPHSTMQETGTAVSLEYAMENPRTIFRIFWRTLQHQSSFYLSSMVASPLGWLEIWIPDIVVFGFLMLLVGSGIVQEENEYKLGPAIRIFGSIAVIGMSVLVLLALLLDCTNIGASTIAGVQGRYFLPMLPLAIVLLHSRAVVYKRNVNRYLILFLTFLHCATVYYASLTIVGR